MDSMWLCLTYLCIFLTVGSQAIAAPIVLDDADAELAGPVNSCTSAGHDGGFHHNGGELADDIVTFAEYNFDPPEDGCYMVEELHPTFDGTCGDFAPQMIPLRINFCKNLSTWGHIDQRVNAGVWNQVIALPFYKGHAASIQITRAGYKDGSPMKVCKTGACFWMADAFRLTYLATSCKDPAVREVMEEELEEDVNEPEKDDEVKVEVLGTSTPNVPEKMLVQALLGEPKFVDDHGCGADCSHAVFAFQPPLDGCYIIEERHTYMPTVPSTPLKVNYCKGLSAVGEINHADGRHNVWNYVASLPFFTEEAGGLVLPASLVRKAADNQGAYEFRLTHIGSRCKTPEVALHHMTLRITADFSYVNNRLNVFGDELAQVLADAASVVSERLDVKYLRSGSVLADIALLPAAAVYGVDLAVGRVNTGVAAEKMRTSLTSASLSAKICGLVHPSLAGSLSCGVSVVASGAAVPIVGTKAPSAERDPGLGENFVAGEERNSDIVIIIGSCVGVVVLVFAIAAVLLCRRRRSQSAPTEGKLDSDVEKGASGQGSSKQGFTVADVGPIQIDPVKPPEDVKDGQSDDASTATPVDAPDNAATADLGDADSGNGSQALDAASPPQP